MAMDGSHVSSAENRPADSAEVDPARNRPASPPAMESWTQEIQRLKSTLHQVVSECTAMQEELERARLEKAVLVEKLKAMEQRRMEVEPLRAQVGDLKAQVERDRLLIERLQVEFRQAILERAQLHKDLFEAHEAVDQLGALLDNPEAPVPPVEPN